ncbi:MAG: MarR family transcriptional regulator [Actinomycetota bacterium]|nr:MarR family transcriptional regulator [Actinomycetota bacterium]
MRTAVRPEAELAAELRLTLTRAARRLRQEAGVELSPSMTSALASIECHGPISPSELATCERVQRPTITRVLVRLQELELVERSADLEDRRSSRLTITPAGRELLLKTRTRKDAFLAARLAQLSREDRDLLEQASKALERLLGEEEP